MPGQVNTPQGGVPWEVFTPEQRSNIEYWSNFYGIPVQATMNILWQESGRGDIAAGTAYLDRNATGAPGVRGIAQLNMNDTGRGVGVTDPMNDGQAIMGLTRAIFTYGTGGTIHDDHFTIGNRPFDLSRGVTFYNGGNRYGNPWEASGRNDATLPTETRNYRDSVFRGITGYNPGEALPSFADAPERMRDWRASDQALGLVGPLDQSAGPGGGTGTGPNARPVGWGTGTGTAGDFWNLYDTLGRGPSGLLGQPPPWETPGIINPGFGHYLQTAGLMPANLMPSGGTDFTNTTWNAVPGSQPGWWGPWGAENVHNWAQEGISHGYGDPIMSMLGNLNYNLVDPGLPPGSPPLGGQPAPIGPRTGLPGTAPAGVDLAHWIAQQWGSPWGSANAMDRPRSNVYDASNMFPQDMRLPWDPGSPRASEWAGHPDLTFWDASRGPGVHVIDQPSGPSGDANPIKVWGGDVTNWVPAAAGSTWGTTGAVSPFTGWQVGQHDLWYSPMTNAWGTPGGNFGPGTPGVENWSPTTGYSGGVGNPSLPPPGTYSGPGYPGSAILPPPGTYENTDPGPGVGYEGSHGITTIDQGILDLGAAINHHAQEMINQGYQTAAHNNQIGQTIWTTGSTVFNPVTGQSVNPWNPMAGINSLTGESNWG